MSTSYIPNRDIKWVDFWKNLPPSLREEIVPDLPKASGTTETSRCLTDGVSHFWCYTGDATDGLVSFERYGLQESVYSIIEAIEAHYDVELISEHDERYWEGMEVDEDEEVGS